MKKLFFISIALVTWLLFFGGSCNGPENEESEECEYNTPPGLQEFSQSADTVVVGGSVTFTSSAFDFSGIKTYYWQANYKAYYGKTVTIPFNKAGHYQIEHSIQNECNVWSPGNLGYVVVIP